jgi:hypothetical protein
MSLQRTAIVVSYRLSAMRWSSIACSILWLSAVNCGSSSPADSADGGQLDGGPSTLEIVQLPGTVLEIKGGAPIVGAHICIVDRPEIPCATSDADGSYTLSMPAWTAPVDIAFFVKADGHLGSTGLVHETPGIVTWLSQPLYSDAPAADLMNQAGFAYPAGGKAFVMLAVVRAIGGAAEGLTASISPAADKGPVYMSPVGTPDPTLTGFSSNGYALFGDLEPGPFEITVSDTSCNPAHIATQGWVDVKPNTIAGLTVADSITNVVVFCE